MLSERISSYGWTPPTIYDFNSSVIFKHLKACLHNANNKRLGKEYVRLFLTCFLIDRCQIVTDTMQSRFFLDVLYYNDIVIKQLYYIRKNYIRALSLVLYPDIYKELNVVENSKKNSVPIHLPTCA